MWQRYEKISGYGGWPLTNSRHFPGEKNIACGQCGSDEITLKTRFTGLGTGPGGRHRMGDTSQEYALCNKCGATGDHNPPRIAIIGEDVWWCDPAAKVFPEDDCSGPKVFKGVAGFEHKPGERINLVNIDPEEIMLIGEGTECHLSEIRLMSEL